MKTLTKTKYLLFVALSLVLAQSALAYPLDYSPMARYQQKHGTSRPEMTNNDPEAIKRRAEKDETRKIIVNNLGWTVDGTTISYNGQNSGYIIDSTYGHMVDLYVESDIGQDGNRVANPAKVSLVRDLALLRDCRLVIADLTGLPEETKNTTLGEGKQCSVELPSGSSGWDQINLINTSEIIINFYHN